MPVFKLYLTERGVKVFMITLVIVVLTFIAFLFGKVASLDKKVEIVKPLEEMQYVDKVWDNEECYYVFKDDKGYDRWYRLITISDSIRFISYYPAIIDYGDDLLIRARWDPTKHVNCKTFLRMAGEYSGIAGKGEIGFCKRYHLPTNKIRTVCGGF